MNALFDLICAEIQDSGALRVDRFMERCLYHPDYGYYRRAKPLGAKGDFITAPEISQLFGEMLGVWAVTLWQSYGSPSVWQIVECGPGRGVMMGDVIRVVTALVPREVWPQVHLVEVSERLCEEQRATLAQSLLSVHWHQHLEHVPRQPSILMANEFFDAFPVRQFIRTEEGVFERLVGLNDEGELCFFLSDGPITEPDLVSLAHDVPLDQVVEYHPAFAGVCRDMASLLEQGLGGIIIDYGGDRNGFGDTLQAVKSHEFSSVFSCLGEQDLTTQVPFLRLKELFSCQSHLSVQGPVSQRDFLMAMGIEARLKALKDTSDPHTRRLLDSGFQRLMWAEKMGTLFKVLLLTSQNVAEAPS